MANVSGCFVSRRLCAVDLISDEKAQRSLFAAFGFLTAPVG
jgi:hypothetical protein